MLSSIAPVAARLTRKQRLALEGASQRWSPAEAIVAHAGNAFAALVRRGLLDRRMDQGNGRRNEYRLTTSGEELRKRLSPRRADTDALY